MVYIFFNPIFILSISLILGLSSTYLNWSSIFSSLDSETENIYLSVSMIGIILSFVLNYKFSKQLKKNSKRLITSFSYSSNDKYLVLFLFLFLIIEVLYSGNIPILTANYSELLESSFGIPVLHGLYLSFLSYISIVFFQKYLSCKVSNKKNNYLFFILLLNVFFILLGRRGTIVFNVVCYFSLYSFYYIGLGYNLKKFILSLSVFIVLFFYGFNYIGNLRLGVNSSDYILNVGKATEEFKQSLVPDEFFYGYLYMSTPVQIFDINRTNTNRPLYDFFLSNIMPDFIAKRLGFIDDIELVKVSGFNVGGLFLSPYVYQGTNGVILLLFYFLILNTLVYFSISNLRKRCLISLSVMMSISFLLPFDNLLNSSGYILQLFYALLFTNLLNFKYASVTLLPVRKIEALKNV